MVQPNPKILIGASIPRSGHHFLVGMLNLYFGSDLYYCETYTSANCCRKVPCSKRGDFGFVYQKSHDRDFRLPPDIGDALYVIQYRHPVAEALSDRELDIKDAVGRPSLNFRRSREGFLIWLAAKAVYYRRFHDKWMAKRLANGIYLDYDALAANPAQALGGIVSRVAGNVDELRVAAATGGDIVRHRVRVASESPYYDAELMAALEDFVVKRCPSFGFSRTFGGDYSQSALYGLILLRDPSEPLPKGENKRFKFAASLAPDHPEVLRRQGVRLLREGKQAQAVQALAALVERYPFYAEGYQYLLKACAEAKEQVPESALSGNALLACAHRPELLLALEGVFRARGYVVNALAASALAAAVNREGDASPDESDDADATSRRR